MLRTGFSSNFVRINQESLIRRNKKKILCREKKSDDMQRKGLCGGIMKEI